MPDIIAIETTSGENKISYIGLSGRPVADDTLSQPDQFADAKATGDGILGATTVSGLENKYTYTVTSVPGNIVLSRIEGKSKQAAFPSLDTPQAIKAVGNDGSVTIRCTSGAFASQITYKVRLHGVGDIKDELRLLMPGEKYTNSSGSEITVDEPTLVVWKRLGEIVYDGSDDEPWGTEDALMKVEISDAKRYYEVTPRNIVNSNFRTTDNIPYDKIPDGVCSLFNADKNSFPGQNWLYVKSDTYNTVDLLKQYLSQNPMTLIYPLATPYAEIIPFEKGLYSTSGECIISSTDPLLPNIDIDVARTRGGAYVLNNFVKGL